MAVKGKKKETRPNEDVKPDKDPKPETNDSCPDNDARANKNNQRPNNDARADKVFEWKISIIGAMILGTFGVIGTLASHWIIENSANAKRCDKLETDVRQKDTIIAEKDARLTEKSERIADQRAEISELKQAVQSKDTQLAVKQSDINFYQMKVSEQTGRMVTRKDDELLKMARGTIKERLGIDDKRPILDQIKDTWNKPLVKESHPGVFIPAPQGLPDSYIAMLSCYSSGDYSNAVDIASKTYRTICPMIEPFSGAQIEFRLALVASETYRIMAESAFHKRQFKRAAYLMGQSAGMVGRVPSPHLLALESAMSYRAGLSKGFFTLHISDAIKANPDEKYRAEIVNELAKLGYLQRYLPNREGTDIGEPMDWEKLCKRKLDLRKLEKRNGDIWSTRWMGFGEYEEFNMSQEFRNDLKAASLK